MWNSKSILRTPEYLEARGSNFLRSFGTFLYRTTRRHIPEDRTLSTDRHDNLIPFLIICDGLDIRH